MHCAVGTGFVRRHRVNTARDRSSTVLLPMKKILLALPLGVMPVVALHRDIVFVTQQQRQALTLDALEVMAGQDAKRRVR